MAEGNVVAFRPFIVLVDVSLELCLITMEITLCFGPFNSKEAAEEWVNVFEVEHHEIEAREAREDEKNNELVVLTTEPYLRAHVHGVDIIQPERGGHDKDALISPSAPIVDAHQVHIYALQGLREAINYTFEYLADKTVK